MLYRSSLLVSKQSWQVGVRFCQQIAFIATASLTLLGSGVVSSQVGDMPALEDLQFVMPAADSFSEKTGTPPVIRAYRTAANGEAELIGYLFQTPDLPPEEIGYSAPLEVLAGIDLQGTLTGIKVLSYRESYKSIRGDFINTERFPEQFEDKNVIEEFRVGRDIDGISRATISSWAVARGGA